MKNFLKKCLIPSFKMWLCPKNLKNLGIKHTKKERDFIKGLLKKSENLLIELDAGLVTHPCFIHSMLFISAQSACANNSPVIKDTLIEVIKVLESTIEFQVYNFTLVKRHLTNKEL